MSYPPPSGQDPNNPYSQPPQGQPQPPGYGYPQQPLPSYSGPQGYGHPQAPGPPPGPAVMPGTVNAARVILYVLGGLGVVGGILSMIGAFALKDTLDDAGSSSDPDTAQLADLGVGAVAGAGVLFLVFGVVGALLASRVAGGGSGLRIGTIVYGALTVVGGVLSLPFGIVHVVLGILVIVFVAKQDGAAWFNRPHY